MLTLVLGTDYIANRNEILRRTAEDVRREKAGRILLVPELITHDMERRLCTSAGDTASRFGEVLSFTRLVRRVCEEIGCAPQPCMDAGGRVVAMASAARQLHGSLKAYASVETKPEFLSDFVSAVDELKRCCISPDDLKQASMQTDGSLAQKLEELSMLFAAYDGICAHGKRDPRDQMTWLLEQLEDSDYAAHHVFYIDGFPDFTRQHLQILAHLICNTDVTVSLNCDTPGSSHGAFEKAGATADELIRIAKEAGVPFEIVRIPPEDVPLRDLYLPIFQGSIAPMALGDRLQVGKQESVFAECMAAAERIMELVRSGVRYRDIVVVCTDMSRYATPLAMLLRRCGIPIYRSGMEDVLSKSAVFTVLAALNAALGDLEQKDVLQYLRSAMSPVSMADCDELENYAILWGIHGKAWTQTWKNNPDGLNKPMTPVQQRKLESLNALREAAVLPLMRLREEVDAAKNLSEQVLAIYRFLEHIQLAERLKTTADALSQAGDGAQAQVLNQLWEILLCAMEQLHDVLGNTVWDRETFARLFKLLLSQYEVGTIPPVLDAVVFGPCNAMRCQQCDHLILLGASEGMLPGYSGSAGILSDQERIMLRQMGVPLTGGAMEGLQAEFADIYGVFCSARQSMRVYYSDKEPSYLYRRLALLAGGEQKCGCLLGAALANKTEAGAYLSRFGAESLARELGVYTEYCFAADHCRHDFGKVSEKSLTGIYGKQLRLSATQTDLLAKCKLAYFLKYGLRAMERKEATVDPAQFGTYVHAVLEKTVNEVMALGGFHCVSLDDVQKISKKHSDAYITEQFSQTESQRVLYLLQRNSRELEMIVEELWTELKQSEFYPIGCEVGFGPGKELSGVQVCGETMQAELIGYVDRVDLWDSGDCKYYRVVDYKTGKKDFDYCDILNGIGLQMLLYLFALEDNGRRLLGGEAIPAGVQYFPARAPLISAPGTMTPEAAAEARLKQWKRKGLLLDHEDVLQAMEPEETKKRLSCKRGKDGEVTGDVASTGQLAMLKKYLFQYLERMVNRIASGDVKPDPYTRGNADNACRYCPYGAVCGFGAVDGRRNYEAVSAKRFWEDVEKEVETNG